MSALDDFATGATTIAHYATGGLVDISGVDVQPEGLDGLVTVGQAAVKTASQVVEHPIDTVTAGVTTTVQGASEVVKDTAGAVASGLWSGLGFPVIAGLVLGAVVLVLVWPYAAPVVKALK